VAPDVLGQTGPGLVLLVAEGFLGWWGAVVSSSGLGDEVEDEAGGAGEGVLLCDGAELGLQR
jgi:hypothetical protein